MKNTTLLTLTLIAASTSAFAQSSYGKSGLSYDRISVGYSSSSNIRSYGVTGSALLGDNFLIGGTYQDIKFKSLGTTTGTGTGFNIGYKFTAGPGDIVLNLGYGQLQAGGVSGGVAILAAGETTDFGIAWRQKINDSLEYAVSFDHSRNNVAAGAVDLTTGASAANGSSTNDNQLGLSLRYNITKSFDVTAGYTFAKSSNVWSLSAGYNF